MSPRKPGLKGVPSSGKLITLKGQKARNQNASDQLISSVAQIALMAHLAKENTKVPTVLISVDSDNFWFASLIDTQLR